ncbi:c-type cytochrome [Horticoccus sp. 23ND18S-11]|uniref:c-type cytochrome n=1 Tax=Horticoccus sp. 23ND18S-11 TaxID=3391832 RepID=UPI0039C9725D
MNAFLGSAGVAPAHSNLQAGRLRSRLRTGLLAVGATLLAATTPAANAGYVVENIPLPPAIRGGVYGLAFSPAGGLVIATRFGEVWIRDQAGAWRLFMRGLDEPTGIVVESERVMYVAHRPELLKAEDTDGDGRAETFTSLGGKWGLETNYHQFFFGLKRDASGHFFGAPSLESQGDKNAPPIRATRGPRDTSDVLQASGHRAETPWRGWVVRIGPDGSFEPFANGFRQPNGMGLSPGGDLFVTDNQGDYKPSTGLLHVARGDFHGHAASVKWEPGYNAATVTTEALWRRTKTPAVVFPHGPMGVSPGEPVWDTSNGKFGPFAGQVFTGDYSRLVVRATLERVAGAWQGACFAFLGRNESAPFVTGDKLKSGFTRSAFAPDGSLYLGSTAGWGAGEDGIQRVTWDGKDTPEMKDIAITERGLRITFTQPMSAETIARAEGFEINRFRYYYHYKYGSPWIDEARVGVKDVIAAADGRSAELVLAELKPGFVYEVSVPTLRSRDGAPIANPLGYYTANRLLNGETTVGGTTRLPLPEETSLGAKEATAASSSPEALRAGGEKIYRLYCVACHQPDGRGIVGGAANFVDDKTRLAKTDAELLDIIAKGVESKGMPPFGAMITPLQRKAVLTYLRVTFGEKKP